MKNIYDLCTTVGEWENKNGISCDRCLTEWYGDMNMIVPLPGVMEKETAKPSRDKDFRFLTYNSHIFIGTKPTAVQFPDGCTISVKKWREAALAILKDGDADPQCHENLLALRDSGVISGPRRRILWADPSSMNAPMEIGPSLYFEGHFGTEYLLKMLCRTLELVGYDYRAMRFQLREREELSL